MGANFENIGLIATGSTDPNNLISPDLSFLGPNFDLSVSNTLTIDAGRITDSGTNSSVFLRAQTIVLQNTSGITGSPTTALAGQISFNAPQIQVNQGSLTFDGFSNVNLNGGSNVTFRGIGSLKTGGGNVNITTPRVATSYYLKPVGFDPSTGALLPPVYTAANYLIDTTVTDGNGKVTGGGAVTMANLSGATSASTAAPGGTLAVTAGGIDISTIVEVPAGQIELTAVNGINLQPGGQLLAQGYYNSSAGTAVPGGVVSLTSTGGGKINLSSGSFIDVSAYQGIQADAGSINFYAPGGVILSGNIRGNAGVAADGKTKGRGGSFSLVTSSIGDFSALNDQLAAGGFTETLNIEATLDDITIPQGKTVTARSVTITTDSGSIDLSGKIDVSQSGQGGTVALYAEKNLTVDSGGYIDAHATTGNASGGDVTLSVDNGMLTFAGGTIDVSGSGTGAGGTVLFRDLPYSPPGGNPTNMSLSGTIKGAESVTAEVDQVYVNQFGTTDGTGRFNTTIDSTAINRIRTDITSYMNNNPGLGTSLASGLTDGSGHSLGAAFHFRPGVVIQSTGSITVNAPTLTQNTWNLSSWRFGGEPGTLTLKAAGSLNINTNIVDTAGLTYDQVLSSNNLPSWSYNLIAGANLNSPNLLAFVPANAQGASGGSLFIGSPRSGNVVYTEAGTIRFASGGDTTIYKSPNKNYMISSSMPYSLATYSGNIHGNVEGSLVIYPGAAIQSATGNIDLRIGKNLNLTGNNPNGATTGANLGAIRTTGERQTNEVDQYGNLVLDGSGSPIPYTYSVFDYYTYHDGGGIALDVTGDVVAGLNANAWMYANSGTIVTAQGVTYYPVTAVYSQTTSVTGAALSFTQGIAAMAGGDVSVRTGGNFDCQIGAFGEGNLQVYSGGDVTGRFLVREGTAGTVSRVSAMGNFGVPMQPFLGKVKSMPQLVESGGAQINVSAQGNVEIGAIVNPNLSEPGSPNYWDNGYTQSSSIALSSATGNVNMYGNVDSSAYGMFYNVGYLPPSVRVWAGKDIVVSGAYTQLPAQDGNLTMQAGGDILFKAGFAWLMSDADFNAVYPGYPSLSHPDLTSHAAKPVHTGDPNAVSISAGGNITDMYITLPKMANIDAEGGSINNLNYIGQNVGPGDTTSIIAAQDIIYGYGAGVANYAIQVGGPGYVVVQAGGKIDLGVSNGIQAIGNAANPVALGAGETGASLIVAAGMANPLDPQALTTFFGALRTAGIEYSNLKSSGDAAGAATVVDNVRASTINPFLATANQGQDITMTSSQISTVGGGGLFVLATGVLNVGTTVLSSGISSRNTGILTETGGAIKVFANGDVNVNESATMTFRGGDIDVWSDHGSINAGKGDKATISASLPTYSCTKEGVCSVKFASPAVGRGIRALTYAPEREHASPTGRRHLPLCALRHHRRRGSGHLRG